jgi:hypothetical protein
MTVSWITPAGNIGTFDERQSIQFTLDASSDVDTVSFTLLAGKLPRGLRLENNKIIGSPTEVRKFIEHKFVIRARDSDNIQDQTFRMSVDGSDVPRWITGEGFLKVGNGDSYYVLDNAYVDFQLEAADTDSIAGDILNYYLVSAGGQLPPGLTLSASGRITGFTDPIFAVEYVGNPTGTFDSSPFDILPLDVPQAQSNGYDSFVYDGVNFDYNEPVRTPRRISRPYAFVVAVSDGVNEIRRLFKIWVVTEEFLKSDNSIVQVDTNLFKADASSRRVPVWTTPSYLGRKRANNYITIFLDVYDPTDLAGTILYFSQNTNPGTYQLKATGEIVSGYVEQSGTNPRFSYNFQGNWKNNITYKVAEAVYYNADGKGGLIWVCIAQNTNVVPGENAYWTTDKISTSSQTFEAASSSLYDVLAPETLSQLPPGLTLNGQTGDLAGKVPYQAAVTKTYTFSLLAVSFPLDLTESTLVGNWSNDIQYTVNQSVRYGGLIYVCTTANQNEIPAETSDFWSLGVSASVKTFSIDIIGEIESAINWISDSDLGSISPNQSSTKYVIAESLLYGNRTSYQLISGKLPPGLELLGTGDIIGKVKQFADDTGLGLTRFFEIDSITALEDSSTASKSFNTTFDNSSTDFDKQFRFKIKARDAANYAENIKEFYITVEVKSQKTFANLYIKSFQPKAQRLEWFNFITDSTIFNGDEIFRYGDANFGVQSELKILVYAGIESQEAVRYVQAMSRNHYNKQILFGDVKSAQALDPVSQEVLYEAVYVEIIDEFESKGKSIKAVVELPDNTNSKVLISTNAIKIDSSIPLVSDRDHQRLFPNSFTNMRNRIKPLGLTDREFLPIWMRSTQPSTPVEPGYTRALVLCYAKPGKASKIISKIKAKSYQATRGAWSESVYYRNPDTITYRGNYYTCILANENKTPDLETKYWSKNFDFKSIDFTADRYLIDVLDQQLENKYLAFPQRGEKLP